MTPDVDENEAGEPGSINPIALGAAPHPAAIGLHRLDPSPQPPPAALVSNNDWTRTLQCLLAPANPDGMQHWQFAFAAGFGPVQAISLQALPGAPWQLQLRLGASSCERGELAARLDELHERLGRKGARIGLIRLDQADTDGLGDVTLQGAGGHVHASR